MIPNQCANYMRMPTNEENSIIQSLIPRIKRSALWEMLSWVGTGAIFLLLQFAMSHGEIEDDTLEVFWIMSIGGIDLILLAAMVFAVFNYIKSRKATQAIANVNYVVASGTATKCKAVNGLCLIDGVVGDNNADVKFEIDDGFIENLLTDRSFLLIHTNDKQYVIANKGNDILLTSKVEVPKTY